MNLQEKIQWLAFPNVLTMETFLTEHLSGHSAIGTCFEASHQLIPDLPASCNSHPHLLDLACLWVESAKFFYDPCYFYLGQKCEENMLWMFYQNSSFYYLTHNSCPPSFNDLKKKKKTRRQGEGGMAIPQIGLGPLGLRARSSSVNLNVCLSSLLF